MRIISSHKVPENIGQIRFLDYLLYHFKDKLTRNRTKKLIKAGKLLLDGCSVESGRYVQPGQLIEWIGDDTQPTRQYERKLNILFEDDYLAVIEKPAGLPVSGNFFRNVQNTLTFNLQPSSSDDALAVLRPVHRLDSQTSGLLLIAKTNQMVNKLGKLFENKQVQKTYTALVSGTIPVNEIINKPIDGKEAITRVEVIETIPSKKYCNITHLILHPLTGRTHQLRIHLSGEGFPIIGDKLYSHPNLLYKGKGLFLSAVGLSFKHPITSDLMGFSLKTPNKFYALIKRAKSGNI